MAEAETGGKVISDEHVLAAKLAAIIDMASAGKLREAQGEILDVAREVREIANQRDAPSTGMSSELPQNDFDYSTTVLAEDLLPELELAVRVLARSDAAPAISLVSAVLTRWQQHFQLPSKPLAEGPQS